MPAFYRMPIVYVLVLILAVAYPIATRIGRLTKSQSAAADTLAKPEPVGESAPEPALATVAILAKEGRKAAAGDGILRTAEGLRRKVVIRELSAIPVDKPVGGRSVGKPLDYYSLHYIRGELGPMFEVGPESGRAIGWLPASACVEWDTRLMARPTARNGRPPMILYREADCLLDAIAGRKCLKHPDRCPTEGEESAAGALDGTRPAMGMPILSTRAIPQPDGSTLSIFEVASLVNDQAPTIAKREPSPELLRALRYVHIAFVIDTTASMQATIDTARKVASDLVAKAASGGNDVILRMALVEYRDAPPGYTYRSRIVNGFTDATGIKAALERISAAKSGDGSVDEAVLDGIAMALPPQSGVGAASGHLKWPIGRAGELATKMVVLLGDSPDHARDLTRANELSDWARQSGITIASVAIEPPFAISRDERARRDAQWQALAEGSYRPLDKASGFADPLPALVVKPDQQKELASRLQALIADRVERARELAALAAAEAEGRLAAYVDSRGLTLDRIAPVLVDLHRGEPEPVARPNPKFAGKKAPSVRKGWIAQKINDIPLVDLEVLMSRDEVDLVIRELAQLQIAISSDSRDLTDLLKIGTAATSGETSFLTVDRGGQTFAEHLRKRQGLPPARPSSLLARTQAELLDADDAYRASLAGRLQQVLSALTKRRDSDDWGDPDATVDGKATVSYDLFDF